MIITETGKCKIRRNGGIEFKHLFLFQLKQLAVCGTTDSLAACWGKKKHEDDRRKSGEIHA